MTISEYLEVKKLSPELLVFRQRLNQPDVETQAEIQQMDSENYQAMYEAYEGTEAE